MEHDESDELVESCLRIANQDEEEEEDDVLEDYQDET